MLRSSHLIAIVTLLLSFPALLLAGGPPWLCLPIDGVTAENAPACARLIEGKLKDGISPNYPGVKLLQHDKQWYATFCLGKPVDLSDVDAALNGSGFSVPQKKLRLFGHVILEVDAGASSAKELLAALETLQNVSVANSAETKDRLLVTVDMPYPADPKGFDRESIAFDSFRRNDFSTGSDRTATTADKLPTLSDFRDLVAQHKATLKSVQWSDIYRMRPLGCVTVVEQAKASAAKR
jgi:hypothetical protein